MFKIANPVISGEESIKTMEKSIKPKRMDSESVAARFFLVALLKPDWRVNACFTCSSNFFSKSRISLPSLSLWGVFGGAALYAATFASYVWIPLSKDVWA